MKTELKGLFTSPSAALCEPQWSSWTALGPSKLLTFVFPIVESEPELKIFIASHVLCRSQNNICRVLMLG